MATMITTLCWVVVYWCYGFGMSKGHASTRVIFEGVPNIDHTNEIVTNDLRNWLLWVRIKVGFTRFRFEFATWGVEIGIYALKSGCVCVCAHFFLGHSTCVVKQCLSYNKVFKIWWYIHNILFFPLEGTMPNLKAYTEALKPRLAIGEYWSTCKYVGPIYVLNFDYWHWFIW